MNNTNNLRTAVGAILAVLAILSCHNEFPVSDLETARAEIEALHEAQRNFHFQKDAKSFADLLSDPHWSVNHGSVRSSSRSENERTFGQYFNSVEFVQWDDVQEPVIFFSDDASLAYTIVDKVVVVRVPGDQGEIVEQTIRYAWLAVYRRGEEGWKIECVASTNGDAVMTTIDLAR